MQSRMASVSVASMRALFFATGHNGPTFSDFTCPTNSSRVTDTSRLRRKQRQTRNLDLNCSKFQSNYPPEVQSMD
jgi:hypothetical protein